MTLVVAPIASASGRSCPVPNFYCMSGLIKMPIHRMGVRRHLLDGPGRAADPREVSNLVVYLASDDSSYSTGSEFVVDGGCTAGLGHKDFSAVEVEQQPEWVT